MWQPLVIDYQQAEDEIDLQSVLTNNIPAIIIHNFFDEKNCKEIVERIKNYNPDNFQNDKLLHFGPFLMEHITDKKKYFEAAKCHQKNIEELFSGIENPINKIYEFIGKMAPRYSVSVATEFQNNYSQAIIRIHKKGKSIPIHKDNVTYEGKEYAVSSIEHQLSCVLHLQESESGGELIIYDKKWKKEDEKFRNIDFGYSSNLIEGTGFHRMSDFAAGDLVIINPNFYHEVTKIAGDTSRITLGMFLGFYTRESKIVAWA